MSLMRDLANQPANVCTPGYLARTAKNLARDYKKLNVRVLNEAECKRLGMGSFLSVTEGTEEPALSDRVRILRRRAQQGARWCWSARA